MPSDSRTSADPALDDAERLPCLTTGAPAPAATIAAIVEMLTDIDRSPPVPTTSSDPAGDRHRGGVRGTSRRRGPGARRWSRPWRAARPRNRRSGSGWPRRRGSPPSPRPSARCAGRDRETRAARTAGHVSAALTRSLRPASVRAAAAARTASASCRRVDRVRHGGLGARPGGQPGVLRPPGEHQDRRAPVDLVLHLLGDPEPTGGHRLAVEDRQVDAPAVHLLRARPARSRPRRTPPRAGRDGGARPRPRITCCAGVRVVAVDKDPQRLGGAVVGHGGDSTGTPSGIGVDRDSRVVCRPVARHAHAKAGGRGGRGGANRHNERRGHLRFRDPRLPPARAPRPAQHGQRRDDRLALQRADVLRGPVRELLHDPFGVPELWAQQTDEAQRRRSPR